MNVLLSIKPRYAEAILSGIKKYEFRRFVFKRNVDRVYIYSTSPMKKIVGVFYIGEIIEGSPGDLWSELKDYSGISEDEFFGYFQNYEKGFAIAIEQVEVFENPVDPFEEFPDFKPPQSFHYIDENMFPLKG